MKFVSHRCGSTAAMIHKRLIVDNYLCRARAELLQGLMSAYFTPLQALSFMTFILWYVPCLATFSVIHEETDSKKWTWFWLCVSDRIFDLLVVLSNGSLAMLLKRGESNDPEHGSWRACVWLCGVDVGSILQKKQEGNCSGCAHAEQCPTAQQIKKSASRRNPDLRFFNSMFPFAQF
ncbi:hypothetical protein BEP19_08420 [Ammoniphilus oxalaticus]|uniref:Uncharacterized protein n=1 Tax=Ammoniphilus oxalaticus TaxID=66863 RepID=A0A419SKA9_9BACL|nr:hypothetical protein [Ammoniphilus oxalaticus]RKD24405.1 hypothetical protein BEP19_08420 [Ammoniphilus oxalaticus]